MDKSVLHKLHPGAKAKGARKLARRKGHLAVWSCIYCKIITHTCSPNEIKLPSIQNFSGMTCFEIAYTLECALLFTKSKRKDKQYMRVIPYYPICVELTELYKTINLRMTFWKNEVNVVRFTSKMRWQFLAYHHLIVIMTLQKNL